ncbi:FMN-binding protein, partial [candidate division KSB1 bacterium]|nr:FMN-binding protein [candidate division KSB1 bacterium]
AEVLIGYVKISSGMGYGGPTSVAVATDTKGEVIGVAIVDSKDTPSYFNRVLNSDFINSLRGKAYDDEFLLGKDVDAVSGATRSSGAILESVRLGSRDIAHRHLGL